MIGGAEFNLSAGLMIWQARGTGGGLSAVWLDHERRMELGKCSEAGDKAPVVEPKRPSSAGNFSTQTVWSSYLREGP